MFVATLWLPGRHRSTDGEFGTFWEGQLDPLIYSCLASFPHVGAKLRVYSYDSNCELPPGVELVDARTICRDETLVGRYIADGQRSFAKFANLFRYRMIRKTGLCWVDTDILCLRRPDFSSSPMVFGRQLEPSHSWSINNAVLKLPISCVCGPRASAAMAWTNGQRRRWAPFSMRSARISAPCRGFAGPPATQSSRPPLLTLLREGVSCAHDAWRVPASRRSSGGECL